MNTVDIVLIIIIAGAIVGAFFLRRHIKKKGSGCCGSCSRCCGCEHGKKDKS